MKIFIFQLINIIYVYKRIASQKNKLKFFKYSQNHPQFIQNQMQKIRVQNIIAFGHNLFLSDRHRAQKSPKNGQKQACPALKRK